MGREYLRESFLEAESTNQLGIRNNARPEQSFSTRNELDSLQRALTAGASWEEVGWWLQDQIVATLREHGAIQELAKAKRQHPFQQQIRKSSNGEVSSYARFSQTVAYGDPLLSFGSLTESFLTVEDSYPQVQLGLRRQAALLTDSGTKEGQVVFWISPTEFYQEPRVPGDKASTYDVLNCSLVTDVWHENDVRVVEVLSQTINIEEGLSSKQRGQLLAVHQPDKQTPSNPTAEEVVVNPVISSQKFTDIESYFGWLNTCVSDSNNFDFVVAGNKMDYLDNYIDQQVVGKMPAFLHKLMLGDFRSFEKLLWNTLRKVKHHDAIHHQLNPEEAWLLYLKKAGNMVHPLTFETLERFIDKSGQWVGGDACGRSEMERMCVHCHRTSIKPPKKICQHCSKHKLSKNRGPRSKELVKGKKDQSKNSIEDSFWRLVVQTMASQHQQTH